MISAALLIRLAGFISLVTGAMIIASLLGLTQCITTQFHTIAFVFGLAIWIEAEISWWRERRSGTTNTTRSGSAKSMRAF